MMETITGTADLSVLDVAQFALSLGDRNFQVTMQLQRLCFFSQGLSLLSRGVPLYHEKSYAGRTAPISFELLKPCRGRFFAEEAQIGRYSGQLSKDDEEIVRKAYVKFKGVYGKVFALLCREYGIAGDTSPYPEIPAEKIKSCAAAFF